MKRAFAPGITLLAVTVGLNAQASADESQPRRILECRTLGPAEGWDEAARFLAGVGSGTLAGKLVPEQRSAWTTYSRGLRSDWNRLRKDHLEPLENWSRSSLTPPASRLAFYPFSGPDAATVMALFPDAQQYVLVGLEPPGCIPASAEDYTPEFFSGVRQSLRTAVVLGFFKTQEMRQEFRESEVRGVLPLLLVMLSRAGYSIVDVAAEGIGPDGTTVRLGAGVRREVRGIAIRFQDPAHGVRTLRYFPLNLENASLLRRPGTVRYLQSLHGEGTLVKSASYLMHKRYFTTIRSIILGTSDTIVEDDSGVPFRYFDGKTWDVRLLGTYVKPVPLFANSYQGDLDAAYASRMPRTPLAFGFGYRSRPGESNLLVATRRAR